MTKLEEAVHGLMQVPFRPPCTTCSLTWYEHVDHDHRGLAQEHGKCPFGDCGLYE